MEIVQTYLNNSLKATVSYANLSKSSTANNYVDELYGNKEKDIDGQNFTLTQAKAFAGVIEQRNEQTGEIIKNAQGEIQYRFETKDKLDFNGNIIFNEK